MKKTSLFLTLILAVFPLFSYAEQALTKELITSFQQVSQQWQRLESKYPELTSSLDDIDLSKPEKMITRLKTSKAYPKIKSLLSNSGFDSIEDFYNVAVRVMGGMMTQQMQNLPQGMTVDSMSQMLKNSLQQMKANNVSGAMVVEMEKQLAEMEKNMKMMKAAMANTSAADKQFFKENAQWIMSTLDAQ